MGSDLYHMRDDINAARRRTLEKKLEAATNALKFYTDKNLWIDIPGEGPPILRDGGTRAKAALERIKRIEQRSEW